MVARKLIPKNKFRLSLYKTNKSINSQKIKIIKTPNSIDIQSPSLQSVKNLLIYNTIFYYTGLINMCQSILTIFLICVSSKSSHYIYI